MKKFPSQGKKKEERRAHNQLSRETHTAKPEAQASGQVQRGEGGANSTSKERVFPRPLGFSMIGTWIPLAGLEARGRGGFSYLNTGGEGFKEAEHRYSVWRGHPKFKAQGLQTQFLRAPRPKETWSTTTKKNVKVGKHYIYNLLRHPGLD